MNDSSKIVSGYICDPDVWRDGPRPKEDRFVFVRNKNATNWHLDNTSHFVNKLVSGNDYQWAEIKKS